MSPTKLSRHGCIPAEPPAVSPCRIIVPRIVIGEVILDQPAGGGIGAVGVGPPCGYGGQGRSCPGREKNALDSARSRLGPESLRRENRYRQKVSRFRTIVGTVRTNGKTRSAAGLQVVVAMLQRNGSRVRSIMNMSSLGTWVRWYLDCTMMYEPQGVSRVWGLSLTRQLTGELGGERAHV
jgi:hypothetical protein